MATNNFDTSLPSIRQLQSWIKDKGITEFKLVTGDVITGRVFWQDPNSVCIIDDNNQQTIIWKQAIAYMKNQG
ncbi:RNA-binding protein hfq [Cronbergia sp. UHCC 0137]|uniref:Hfq-related RNA-binding protein n=1 Tax=Cronbergia sp. UHCC 0137 TaxID=3110239 RepID=UPI002B1E9EAD|nr:RNA-binding protein hfq [Cronbergia sp. UHCC 0137]MEA5617907.1 RNA-binding protein hfq [Cronbergia sp. UHCC 0137]